MRSRYLPLILFTLTLAVGISSALAVPTVTLSIDRIEEPKEEASGAVIEASTKKIPKDQMIIIVDMTAKDIYASAGAGAYVLKGMTQSGVMLHRSTGEAGLVQTSATFQDLENNDQNIVAELNEKGLVMLRVVRNGDKVAGLKVGQARSPKNTPYQFSKAEMNAKMKERFTGDYTKAVMSELTAQVKASIPDIKIRYVQDTEYLTGYTCRTAVPTHDLHCTFRVRISILIGLD